LSAEGKALPILIVEDDEPTQNLLRAVLRRVDFPTEIAANGADAIALLQQKPYALVLLDIMMPEVSGRDVIDYLAGAASPVPVIICSAAGPSAFADVDPAVVKEIVRKPFDIDEIISAVIRITSATQPGS
jgi:CheY-like chemotaxis protein